MSSKLKNVLICALSGVLAASAFSGCTSSNKNAGLTEDGKLLLEMSTTPKDVYEPGYTRAMESYKKFTEYYETAHPDSKGIHIEPNFYVFNTKDYAAMAIGDQLATYYTVPLTEAKGIMDAGYGKDITKWMEKYDYLNGIDEKIKKNIERDGKYYLMPYELYSVGIAVNMEILEQAGYVEADGTPHQPKTFEELAEMASDITKKTGKPGFILPTTNNTGGWRFTPIAWAYGVEFMKQDKDGNWQATFNTQECVDALQWVKDLKWKYNAIPENVLLDTTKERAAFGAGESAMIFAEGSSATPFIQAGLKKENLGFIQMPAGPKRHVTLIGGKYIVFNKNATDEQIEAGFEYLEWNGNGRGLNDEVKKNLENTYKQKFERNEPIGILNASPYTDDDAKRAFIIELNTEKYVNINMNHVKLYNDQSNIEWQQEEPVEAQALYAVLDNAIQAVLTDENADCTKLIQQAYENFQSTLNTVNAG